ncbi:MAG: hypothetical protein HY744_15260, partial [Deltaproteobacteria bacterium]|nr:hypothetical protein [Deltaproteobacteria bacterium]
VCDKQNGNCKQEPVPPGGKCNEAADDCNHGQCDDNGKCLPVPANENGPCKTDSCHSGESCKAGKCQGGGVIDQCVNKDGCCPPGCDQSNDDDCQSYVFLTSSNGIAGFYQYDIKKNSWSTVKSPPVVTHTQITNDGKYVYLMGDDNQVHRYDPVGASWQAAVPGPGNVVKSPIGFFQWFEPGFYYCKDGQNTMYVYRNNAWKSFSLGSSCSCAGSWDAAKKELYVRTYGQLGFQVVNTANDTVARTIADATNVGENSRSGSFYGGYFYSRTWDGPFQKFDGINGIKTDTGAKPAAGHTATDTDFKNAVIYVSGYGGQATVFQAFDTKTNTIKNAANQPAVDNHSTITVMR